jgi:hypothetical protein
MRQLKLLLAEDFWSLISPQALQCTDANASSTGVRMPCISDSNQLAVDFTAPECWHTRSTEQISKSTMMAKHLQHIADQCAADTATSWLMHRTWMLTVGGTYSLYLAIHVALCPLGMLNWLVVDPSGVFKTGVPAVDTRDIRTCVSG